MTDHGIRLAGIREMATPERGHRKCAEEPCNVCYLLARLDEAEAKLSALRLAYERHIPVSLMTLSKALSADCADKPGIVALLVAMIDVGDAELAEAKAQRLLPPHAVDDYYDQDDPCVLAHRAAIHRTIDASMRFTEVAEEVMRDPDVRALVDEVRARR